MRIADKRAGEAVHLTLDGEAVMVPVRRRAQARRLTLRIDAAQGAPAVSAPPGVRLSEIEDFVAKSRGWLAKRLAQLPAGRPFVDGGAVPLRGVACRIVHRPGRGVVAFTEAFGEPRIVVPGAAEHLARRLTDWLKREARRDLVAAVARHSARLGRRPATVRVGDARSRWGSCSSARVLSFSWRLILAPPMVLDYLAAHEAAHLVEMNHGRAFWRLVAELCPVHGAARAWLKRHGPGLHAWGRG